MSAIHRNNRRWAQIRARFQAELDAAGAIPCWRCGRLIRAGEPWHLGHLVDRALGGTDDQLAPEHPTCSMRAGGQLSDALFRQRYPQGWRLTGPRGQLFGDDDQ